MVLISFSLGLSFFHEYIDKGIQFEGRICETKIISLETKLFANGFAVLEFFNLNCERSVAVNDDLDLYSVEDFSSEDDEYDENELAGELLIY